MVGKKSGKALLREEGPSHFPINSHHTDEALTGLQRTDNNMKQTSWPEIMMINQKNYYTYVAPLPELAKIVRFTGSWAIFRQIFDSDVI